MAAMKTRGPGLAAARERCRALILLSLLLSFPACFSFRVNVPPEPEDMVGTLAIIHSEPAALDLEKPIPDEEISVSDPNAIALIKVLQVSRPLTLQWHWYSPDNRLVRSSKTVQINSKARYLAYFAAWDRMPRDLFSEQKGSWTVVITADGSFLASKEFTVN